MEVTFGRWLMSSAVSQTVNTNKEFEEQIMRAVARYTSKDWGDLCDEDKQANESAIIQGDRILAKYDTCEGNIYIITEADRSITTVLFVEEY